MRTIPHNLLFTLRYGNEIIETKKYGAQIKCPVFGLGQLLNRPGVGLDARYSPVGATNRGLHPTNPTGRMYRALRAVKSALKNNARFHGNMCERELIFIARRDKRRPPPRVAATTVIHPQSSVENGGKDNTVIAYARN
jgi:hypothetical protein